MLFNSAEFLVFFPIAVILYFLTPPRARWALLLAASYYFYGSWRVEYLGLLMFSTVVDYFTGIGLERAGENWRRRKLILSASLATNLGLLLVFKYFNFFVDSVNQIGAQFNLFAQLPELRILLPVGISFYTFQSLAYTISVYRGTLAAEHHFGKFAVYVAFWPQLVAGPIEKPGVLLPQFHVEHKFTWENLRAGLLLMLWGFFKKIAIADRLAIYVNQVYNAPGQYDGAALLVATYLFAFQIYCDFSGYSAIAKGAAKVMGFELMNNFDRPYFAASIREFWQRWHISLSTWFRDYVYIPLGGNRDHQLRNLFLTFLVSGLWHGANWTFVIWGALHGAYLVTSIVTRGLRERLVTLTGLDRSPRLLQALRVAMTFHLVLFAWIFFRANTASDVWLVCGKIAGLIASPASLLALAAPFDQPRDLLFIALLLAVVGTVSALNQRGWRMPDFAARPYLATAAVAIQFWAITVFGVFDNQTFIYFQF